MKALFTLIFLLVGSFYFVSDAQIKGEYSDFDKMYEENMIEYSFMRKLKINGEAISRNETRSVLMQYPESAKYYRQSQNLDIALIPVSVGILSTWIASNARQRRLGEQYNSNRDIWMMACTALNIGGLAIIIVGESKIRKAVDARNKAVLREMW